MTNPGNERLSSVRARFSNGVLPALRAYTAIECLSPVFDPDWKAHGELRTAAELLASWAGEHLGGARALEIIELEGRTPLLFAEIPPSNGWPSGPTTLVYGHFDKQPALGPWREGLGPFTPVQEGDRLYGRGTADDGYATFAAFTALETLADEGAGHGRIVLLIEGSEESGSPDLDAYLEHLHDRLGEVGLVICLDSGCPTYDRLWTTTSLRGIAVVTLTVEVMTSGVHSGHAGGIVPSSFRIARELLSRVEDPRTGEILCTPCHAPLDAGRRRAIAEVAEEFGEIAAGTFPTVPGLELSGTDIAARIENGIWQPALEVIGFSGAPAPSDAGNVLRAETTLRLAIRLPPTVDAAVAAEAFAEELRRDPPAHAAVTVTVDQSAAGWVAPDPTPRLAALLDRASLTYFGAPYRSIGLGGSIPFMTDLGQRFPTTQFVATGVLGPESNAHGPDEFLHLPTAVAITATVADLLAEPW